MLKIFLVLFSLVCMSSYSQEIFEVNRQNIKRVSLVEASEKLCEEIDFMYVYVFSKVKIELLSGKTIDLEIEEGKVDYFDKREYLDTLCAAAAAKSTGSANGMAIMEKILEIMDGELELVRRGDELKCIVPIGSIKSNHDNYSFQQSSKLVPCK